MTDGQAPELEHQPGSPSGGRRLARFLGVSLIGALIILGMLIAFPPVNILKDQLARDLGTALGRTITIESAALKFKLAPEVDTEISGVTVSNPAAMPQGTFFKGATVRATLELLPLLKGRVKISGLKLIKPEFHLEEGADGARNWVFPVGGTKGDALKFPESASIEDGILTFTSARTGARREASQLTAVVAEDPITGAASAKGSMAVGGEPVSFDVAIADFVAAAAGKSSAVTVVVDSRPIKATLSGDANFSAAATFEGKVTGSSASLLDLAKWLGATTTAEGEPLKSAIDGTIKATTRDITFVGTDISINSLSSRLDGRLDLSGPRPKLEGTIDAERVDLERIGGRVASASSGRRGLLAEAAATAESEIEVQDAWAPLLEDLKTLENGGPAPGLAPEAEGDEAARSASPQAAAAKAKAPGWSEQPFNFKAISLLDLDVTIKAREVIYGSLDLKQAQMKALINNGVLNANLEDMQVGEGNAQGTISLDSKANPPMAQVALKLKDVAAEPIISELAGRPLLSGKSNVDITAKAQGQNQSQLASTLEGKARFQMGKGALRGFDVRRMVSEWWRKWSFDLGMKTGFEKLEAQYDIKKGVMRSEPGLDVDGSEVSINSRGEVNVPARRLNQEIRIKVIPPPTALPIPVRISGDWAKPNIGVDWGRIFAAPEAELGGPQGVTPSAEPPPAEVQAAIQRVLASDLPADKLTPAGRAMLQSLLPSSETQGVAP